MGKSAQEGLSALAVQGLKDSDVTGIRVSDGIILCRVDIPNPLPWYKDLHDLMRYCNNMQRKPLYFVRDVLYDAGHL